MDVASVQTPAQSSECKRCARVAVTLPVPRVVGECPELDVSDSVVLIVEMVLYGVAIAVLWTMTCCICNEPNTRLTLKQQCMTAGALLIGLVSLFRALIVIVPFCKKRVAYALAVPLNQQALGLTTWELEVSLLELS